ncbi:MAG: hypothetical protein E7202_01495 [Selenomonas ruminantium]|nr:hypothetical protein [Selenomonas ruminantium]
MARLCIKCGSNISDYDEICTKCGFCLGRTVNVEKTNSYPLKRKSLGVTSVIVIASLFVVSIQLGDYYMDNSEKDVVEVETLSEGENAEGEVPKKKIKQKEPMFEKSKPEKKIQFTTYKDELRKFQIDYPDTIKMPDKNQKRYRDSATQYKEDISDKCVIIYGNFFRTIDKKIDIKRWMESEKFNSFNDIKNIKMYKVSDIAYGYEYEKNGVHVIGKEYFGKVGESGQSHYVQLRYTKDVEEKDLLIARQMFDSFKPGFDNKGK